MEGHDSDSNDGKTIEYEHIPITMSKLQDHIQELLAKTDPNDVYYNGFDDEFNYIEQKTIQDQYFGDYKSAMLLPNKSKNRYSNVLPPENTRVKLKEREEEEGSDFINANYINGLIEGSEKAYIATQGPLQTTFVDFWRMIWELQVTVVVMLTKEVENDRIKCDRYWPEMDCPLSFDGFKITLVDIEETSKDELITRKLLLENTETGEERTIAQLQYIAWPDHGLPTSTTAFLELIDEADSFKSTAPIIVHCSAGIGRSGTFCAVHSILEKLKLDLQEDPNAEISFNIVQTILDMRSQRPGMVQTKEQYMFIYLAILEKARELLAKARGEPFEVGRKFLRTSLKISQDDSIDSSTTSESEDESESSSEEEEGKE